MKLNYYWVCLLCLLTACNTSNSIQKQSQTNDQQSLFFSTVDFKKNSTTSDGYIDHFTLHKDAFLNIHFTLEQPLIEHLELIAPHLSQEALLSKGNFQFSFLVDGTTIHVENLNIGAGTLDSKTSQLKHTIPLIYPQQIDFWGWFMWLKFMKLSGGQDVLLGNNHSLSIEVRPYIKEETIEVGPILAKGNIAIDVEKPQIDESLVPVQAIQAKSGWQLSKAHYDHSKIEALNRKIAENRFENINGIIVIKDQKLLIEEYFNGADRHTLHDPRSVGKSFASTLLGIAIKDNYISSEHTYLKDFYNLESYKNYSTKKDAVTLKSLLTMSSGFMGDDSDYSSPGNEENMYPTDNWVTFSLDLPMQQTYNIGEDFTYFTGGVVVLGDIIHKSVPGGLVTYADDKLFKPLGITKYKWQYTPQNIGNTAGGIQLRALDFAKFGQLYKNKGQWNGQQILSDTWVKKSLSKQVSQAHAGIKNGYYGYLFWNKTYTIDGTSYEASFCSGRGGNKIFIFKELPFVIVITSSAYNNPNAHSDVDKMMTTYILPAIIEKT